LTAAATIATAEEVLAGRVAVPVHLRVITAAHLARCALEHAITAVLEARGHQLPRANGRSRLIVLRVLDEAAGAHAGHAWDGLSRACHRHAFELPPSEAEVRALLDDVRAVLMTITVS
jgi:hypothetical protein